ncbi:MAG: TolC family protein [Myxococcales bacterium]|nr:TolC family protein [Myxococcales bacterium]
MPSQVLSAIVVIWICTAGANAEQALDVMDERTLIKAIEAGDPRVELIAAEVDAAAAEVLAARRRPDPRIAVDREEVFPAGGGLATSYVRVVVPLDISGRRGRMIAAATANLGAARAESDVQRFVLVVDALRVFREAEYLRLRVGSMTADRGALARAVDIVAKRARAGEAAGYDQQRLELELAAYDDLIASAAIDLRVAQQRLASLVGRPGQRVDAAGALAPVTTPVPALETLLGDPLAQRGDYRAAKLRLDAAAADRAAADRAWVPSLELTAGAMSSDLGTGSASGYVAGLSFSLPIFDRGAAGRARADAARRTAAADARLLEREITSAIRIAYETWTERAAQVARFESAQLAPLEQLLRSAETAYRDGGGSIVELLDAYRTAREARLRNLELRRETSLAVLDLWRALGTRP